MGYRKISLLSVWQQIHITNRSEATCFNILETPNQCVSKNTEINCMCFTIQVPHCIHPGKQIPMTNVLLRNLKISEDKEEDQISLSVLVVTYIPSNYQQYPEKFVMNKMTEETSKDATLQLLAKYITNGWPVDQKKIPKEQHPYWNYRDEISIEDSILLKLNRILILHTLHTEMLDLIHEGHQGIKKCLLHSRESLFWPGITDEICQAENKCLICQSTPTAQRKLPSVPSEIPPHA